MPQRIFRKFSSRRKKRKNDDDVENPRGKTRVAKTLSNASLSKIGKIAEEPDPRKDKQAEGKEIKMEVLDALTTVNEFENQSYETSGSSSSQEHNDSPKKSLKGTHGNNFELDTISEIPSSCLTEGTEDNITDDNKNDTNDRTLVHNSVYATTSLQQEIENELHAPIEQGKTRNESSSTQDEVSSESKPPSMFSTDC